MEEDPQLCVEDMLANPMEGAPNCRLSKTQCNNKGSGEICDKDSKTPIDSCILGDGHQSNSRDLEFRLDIPYTYICVNIYIYIHT